jgi:hypothetical protein
MHFLIHLCSSTAQTRFAEQAGGLYACAHKFWRRRNRLLRDRSIVLTMLADGTKFHGKRFFKLENDCSLVLDCVEKEARLPYLFRPISDSKLISGQEN